MTTNTADLLLEYLVVESCLEFTLPRRGGRDIHGGLTTTEDDIVFFRGDGCAVEGRVCDVRLEHLEVARADELGGLVLAGGDEVCPVGAPLQVGDLAAELVHRDVVDEVAVLAIVLADGAVLVAGNDVLGQVAPAGDSGLALVADNGQNLLRVLLGGWVAVDVEDNNGAQVAHTLLGDAQQLGAILGKLDALDGSGEVPSHQALACLDLPQLDSVVGGTGSNDGGGRIDVDGPDGALVAVVGAHALAVVGEPGANMLVLCRGEDDVAIAVESARQQAKRSVSNVFL